MLNTNPGRWQAQATPGMAHWMTLQEFKESQHGTEVPLIPLGVYRDSETLQEYPFVLSTSQLNRHLFVVSDATSGMATSIVKMLFWSLCQAKRSFAVFDWKGGFRDRCEEYAQHWKYTFASEIFGDTRYVSPYYNPLAHISPLIEQSPEFFARQQHEAANLAEVWLTNTRSIVNTLSTDRDYAQRALTSWILHRCAITPSGYVDEMRITETVWQDELVNICEHSPSSTARAILTTLFKEIPTGAARARWHQLLYSCAIHCDEALRGWSGGKEDNQDFLLPLREKAILYYGATFSINIEAGLPAMLLTQLLQKWLHAAEDWHHVNLHLPAEERAPQPFPAYIFLADEFLCGDVPLLVRSLNTLANYGIGVIVAHPKPLPVTTSNFVSIAEAFFRYAGTQLLLPGSGKDYCEAYSERCGTTTQKMPITLTASSSATKGTIEEKKIYRDALVPLVQPHRIRLASEPLAFFYRPECAPTMLEIAV